MTRTTRFAQNALIAVFVSGFAINLAVVLLSWGRSDLHRQHAEISGRRRSSG